MLPTKWSNQYAWLALNKRSDLFSTFVLIFDVSSILNWLIFQFSASSFCRVAPVSGKKWGNSIENEMALLLTSNVSCSTITNQTSARLLAIDWNYSAPAFDQITSLNMSNNLNIFWFTVKSFHLKWIITLLTNPESSSFQQNKSIAITPNISFAIPQKR